MYFRTKIKNLISLELSKKELIKQSLIGFTDIPYIIAKNNTIELSNARYERGCFLIEHFMVTGKKSSQIKIQCIQENYVLIVCLQGKISYSLPRTFSQPINMLEKDCILIHSRPFNFVAYTMGYPIEILTIAIHPDIMMTLSSHHPELSAFILQYKNAPLSTLNLVQVNKYFLNKISKILNWNTNKNLTFDQQLLKYIPLILSEYRNLIFPQSRHSSNKSLVEQAQLIIKNSLERNEVPNASTLARKNSVYPSKLNDAFKTITGMTLAKFIRNSVLLRISEILPIKNMGLLEIALLFGYADVNSLNRAFKKKFGTSMGAYRNIQKSTFSNTT